LHFCDANRAETPIAAQSLGIDAQFAVISPIFNARCRTLSAPRPVLRFPLQPPAPVLRIMMDGSTTTSFLVQAPLAFLLASGLET